MMRMLYSPGMYYFKIVSSSKGKAKSVNTVTGFDLFQQTFGMGGELCSVIEKLGEITKEMGLFRVAELDLVCHHLEKFWSTSEEADAAQQTTRNEIRLFFLFQLGQFPVDRNQVGHYPYKYNYNRCYNYINFARASECGSHFHSR